ncbi:hypothetical protein [Caulobacter soli]|uniref:hypothetical protein n=1 Tax=Caulobacter soli TaxID=2708539 RepID=UPI0013EA9A26|nr:hypothetical protein [Caulobacter soli]
MPSRSARSNALKPENKALVVFTSALQLMAIVVVWLLAIIPVGLMALAVTLWKLASKLVPHAGAAKSVPPL